MVTQIREKLLRSFCALKAGRNNLDFHMGLEVIEDFVNNYNCSGISYLDFLNTVEDFIDYQIAHGDVTDEGFYAMKNALKVVYLYREMFLKERFLNS